MPEVDEVRPAPARRRFDPSVVRRGPRTFGRRIALAFAAVAALTALLSGALISAAWNYQFESYVRDNLQHTSDGIAQIIEQAYPAYGGWTLVTLAQIPRFGESSGIGIQVLDETGSVIYDDATMSAAMQQMMQSGNAQSNTQPQGKGFVLKPSVPVVTSAITVEGKQVGSVRVWAYGSGALMTERDQRFRRGSFIGLFIAACAAIVLASLAGLAYSRLLVRPIQRITETAQRLRGGDRDARTGLSADDEIGFLATSFDEMADSIEADRELERRLTADVAHELRTPLQAIQATVEAMQDGVLPADEERLGTVRDETVRLSRLASGILELTRLERGRVPFDCARLDLSVPVRMAVDAHAALFESCSVELLADTPEGIFVNGDTDRLQQAVGNLLGNAARYTPPGGTVRVSVGVSGDDALVTVEDTGIGIAEEDLPYVFSRFWRADAARDRSSGGLGIGLAVTREIVERHRGSITAERREAGGTRFTVRLPRG